MKRSRFGLILAAALALGPCLLSLREADAKSSYDSQYGYERTWNAALRLVVVDLSFKVNEKDAQSGYILFDYKSTESGAKATPGSFELIRGQTPSEPVHVIAQLPAMPSYHEQVLLDELARKLKDEYGEPIVIKKQAPVEDAGAPDAEQY